MKRWLYILPFILVLVTACTPEKKLARLVRKHPELLKADTLTFFDTLITHSIHADSSYHYSRLRDTIVLIQDRLRVQVYQYHDSIFINGSYTGDTVVRKVVVPYNYVEATTKTENQWWVGPLIGFLIALCGFFFLRARQKPENRP